ncbi:MAG: phosphatidylglycerophosphatase A [Acidobacteriota bacterium]|jgi:phosphatidylglycerophosphatase A|nr:phosphatidylglycerophosphatase A [Acidobacteriota bacterium]
MRQRISILLASAFHIGFIPGAPGTYASIATTLGFYLVFLVSWRILPSLHLSAVCLITILGVLTAADASRHAGNEDPSFVVIDEVAGQLLTFLFLPVTALNLILGTLVFRLFDIWKPYPIRKLEPLKNGVGIMADDLLAGIYANLVLQLVHLSI